MQSGKHMITVKGDKFEDVQIRTNNPRFTITSVRPSGVLEEPALSIKVGFKGGLMEAGEMVVNFDGSTISIFHFEVEPRVRRKGVGSFMIKVFNGLILWTDPDEVSAIIGGDESTKSFLMNNGYQEQMLGTQEMDNGEDITELKGDVGDIDIDETEYNIT